MRKKQFLVKRCYRVWFLSVRYPLWSQPPYTRYMNKMAHSARAYRYATIHENEATHD